MFGAEPPLLEMAALQPPEKVADASQALYVASMAACVWQAVWVLFAGHVSVTAGAAVTVKEAEQVFGGSQLLEAVNVTVVEPPQAGGAPALLLLTDTLHPPVVLTLASQVANFALMAASVWHAASVTLNGQSKTSKGAAVTVNTAEQVTSDSHVDVTVQVTVLDPPQSSGAAPPLLEMAALQPPEKLAEASQAL